MPFCVVSNARSQVVLVSQGFPNQAGGLGHSSGSGNDNAFQSQHSAPGFSPSGEILAMLGGQGNDQAQGGIGSGALSNLGGAAVGPSGNKGEDLAFDMSEFPALANRIAGQLQEEATEASDGDGSASEIRSKSMGPLGSRLIISRP